MAGSKRKEAEEIVRQIEETVPVDRQFAMVFGTGEWVLSPYIAVSPGEGPVGILLGPPTNAYYHEGSVRLVQRLLEKEQQNELD